MNPSREPGPHVPGWLADLLAALVVVVLNAGFLVVVTVLGEVVDQMTIAPWAWVVWGIATVASVVLMFFRRAAPVPVLAGVLVCALVESLVLPVGLGSFAAVVFALYTAVVTLRRGVGWLVAAATAAALVLIQLVSDGGAVWPAIIQVVLVVGVAAAVGEATRNRRQYLRELRFRAERAEQTREAEASRAVAEERLRIARDLHDAVAHQISVISLNAGVASASLETDPGAAREALAGIRSASREVLTEIGDLLGTLRTPDDERRRPTVGVAALDDLVAGFVDSGMSVTVRLDGDAGALPPAVDVVVYRVIQEALTNAHKHGTPARAHVLLSTSDSEVRVVVTNPAVAAGRPGDGHGLVGMRERLMSVRGTLTTGLADETFSLEAMIPLGQDEP